MAEPPFLRLDAVQLAVLLSEGLVDRCVTSSVEVELEFNITYRYTVEIRLCETSELVWRASFLEVVPRGVGPDFRRILCRCEGTEAGEVVRLYPTSEFRAPGVED
jgi:hypothetical protein